jgi:hypothetical protein
VGIPSHRFPIPQHPSLLPPLGMSSCSSGDAVTGCRLRRHSRHSHRCARCHSNQSQLCWNKPCTRQLQKTAGSGLGPTPSARSRSLEIGSRTRLDPDHPRSHAASPAERRPRGGIRASAVGRSQRKGKCHPKRNCHPALAVWCRDPRSESWRRRIRFCAWLCKQHTIP